jgi:hypothetical protein
MKHEKDKRIAHDAIGTIKRPKDHSKLIHANDTNGRNVKIIGIKTLSSNKELCHLS